MDRKSTGRGPEIRNPDIHEIQPFGDMGRAIDSGVSGWIKGK